MMNVIDLTPFGFPYQFHYHGRIKEQRQDGGRLLFLVNERHRNAGSYEMRRLNLLNACELCRLGIIGLVAVEEPLSDERPPTPLDEERATALVRDHGSFEAAVDFLYRRNPDNEFSTVLQCVFPHIPIRCAEDPELRRRTRLLFDHCLAASFDENPRALPEYNFDSNPIHLERDEAFLRTLFGAWEKYAGKAAILHGGRSHLDRILGQLPPDVRFIQMETEEGQ